LVHVGSKKLPTDVEPDIAIKSLALADDKRQALRAVFIAWTGLLFAE
jgi:hypothetical protein